MESIKTKVLLNKSGGKRGGSVMTRVTIPAGWARDLGITEDSRDIILTFDGDEITIKPNRELMNMKMELLERFHKELDDMGFVDDSDNTDRFLDEEAYKILERNFDDPDEAYDNVQGLVEETKDLIEIDDIKFDNETFVYIKDEEGLRKYSEAYLESKQLGEWTREELEDLIESHIDEI